MGGGDPTHHASARSWLVAGLLAPVGAYACYHFARTAKEGATRLWVGVVVFAAMTVWMLAEFVRLRRKVVAIFERGFVYEDGQVRHEVDWSDVVAIEAQHVPGLSRAGAGNPSNLVAIVVSVPAGAISLVRELSGFDALVEAFRTRTKVEWRKVTIGSLMERS